MLRKLCEKLDIRFNKRMLNWPSGKRDTDGIWAPHWYSEVEKTTGFQPYSYGDTTLEDNWKKFLDQGGWNGEGGKRPDNDSRKKGSEVEKK